MLISLNECEEWLQDLLRELDEDRRWQDNNEPEPINYEDEVEE